MEDLVEALKIMVCCVAGAVLYGMLHDQVTARVCVEYFTIAHPHLIDSESPTLLALAWGTVATWWAGVIMAFPAMFAARLGWGPKFTAAEVARRIGVLLIVMAFASLAAGLVGYYQTQSGQIQIYPGYADLIPKAKHARFMFDAYAHLAAYGIGFVGGLVVCISIVVSRVRRTIPAKSSTRPVPTSPSSQIQL